MCLPSTVSTLHAYLCVFAFPYLSAYTVRATAFRSTLWFLPLQAPSPSTLCDRTPAVQRSFNERSTRERRNEEQEEEKDFMGLYFFFRGTTCAVLRDVKAVSLCGNLRLALISIVITLQTQKISSALARGGIHPNTPLPCPHIHTGDCPHSTWATYLPFSILSKKKYKWVSP